MRAGLLHPVRDPPRPGVGIRQLPGAGLLLTADFFDEAYHRLLEPFHPEEAARRETSAIRELLGLAQDDRVLDLGCGWGRHLKLLREAGHEVTGFDLSLPLLRQVAGSTAGQASAGEPATGLVAGDMLSLPFRDGAFDVVLNLATSLGLFLNDSPAMAALGEARRVLRPGGRLLVEVMHRDDVVAGYAIRDRWTLDDGTIVRARRRFDAVRGVSHEVLRWREPDGEERVKRHSLRLRSATTMVRLLNRAGFEMRGVWGGWDGESFHADSPRLIVRAEPTLPAPPLEP